MPVKAKIEKELKTLPEGWIILLETKAENSLEVGLESMKMLTDKGYSAIIVSASRPCNNLLSLYQSKKIDTKRIFLLDLICKSQGVDIKDKENVMHLENVSALTDISISINELMKSIKGQKFIFIDSITSMLIHNRSDVFAKFIHSLLTKMRLNGVSGLLISIEGETAKEVRSEIAQLCDKIVSV